MIDFANILAFRFAGKEWTLVGDDYEGLEWRDESPKPSKAELEKLWPTVQADIEAERKARVERKLSVIEKLGALGLTADEVADVFGLEVQA